MRCWIWKQRQTWKQRQKTEKRRQNTEIENGERERGAETRWTQAERDWLREIRQTEGSGDRERKRNGSKKKMKLCPAIKSSVVSRQFSTEDAHSNTTTTKKQVQLHESKNTADALPRDLSLHSISLQTWTFCKPFSVLSTCLYHFEDFLVSLLLIMSQQ